MLRAIVAGSLAALLLGSAVPAGAQAPVTTTYTATDAVFPNPERGFYAHRSSSAGLPVLTAADLRGLRNDASITLVLRLYYLKTFRDRPLSQDVLDLIAQDFDALREAGAKAVLRFAYSSSQNEPDAPLDVILGHLDQLEPLLRANSDVVATVQAGLIGAWGEWYYSSNGLNTTTARRAVTEKWLDVLPEGRMVQVRTPDYKRLIFERTTPLSAEEGYGDSGFARTGHHNDCFLASSTDFGTYQNVATDKAFLEADSRYTAVGGETCNPNPPRSECATALEEMARFHWSYLNRDYHSGVLGSWYTGGCMNEVRRRLGYRFRLLDSEVTGTVRPGGALDVSLRLANGGFAAPYNPRRVEVVLRERQSGARYVATLPDDPRHWAAGDTVTVVATLGVPATLPEGSYDVLFNLPAPEASLYARPEYAIRLANEDVWEPTTGYNDLLVDVAVAAGAGGDAYAGTRWLQPYEQHIAAERERPAGTDVVSSVHPNPFQHRAEVEVTVPAAQRVRIRIYDVLGREAVRLHDGLLAPGRPHAFTFEAAGLPPGTYFVRVEGETFAATRPVVHVR